MATEAKTNAGGKLEQKAAEAFGTPQTKVTNPKRETISFASLGDLQIRFEVLEWLNKEDPSKGYDPPVPNFVAFVDGYKNTGGYRKEIPLSGDPEELRNMAMILTKIAKFVEDTEIDITKAEYFVDDIGKAYEKLAPNGKAPKGGN